MKRLVVWHLKIVLYCLGLLTWFFINIFFRSSGYIQDKKKKKKRKENGIHAAAHGPELCRVSKSGYGSFFIQLSKRVCLKIWAHNTNCRCHSLSPKCAVVTQLKDVKELSFPFLTSGNQFPNPQGQSSGNDLAPQENMTVPFQCFRAMLGEGSCQTMWARRF